MAGNVEIGSREATNIFIGGVVMRELPEKVKPTDIPWKKPGAKRGVKLKIETEALLSLAEGEAVKIPCRWQHFRGTEACNGASWAYSTANRNGFKVRASCMEKYLYVFRKNY